MARRLYQAWPALRSVWHRFQREGPRLPWAPRGFGRGLLARQHSRPGGETRTAQKYTRRRPLRPSLATQMSTASYSASKPRVYRSAQWLSLAENACLASNFLPAPCSKCNAPVSVRARFANVAVVQQAGVRAQAHAQTRASIMVSVLKRHACKQSTCHACLYSYEPEREKFQREYPRAFRCATHIGTC